MTQKLDIHETASLVLYAVRNGIVQPRAIRRMPHGRCRSRDALRTG
jgi:hypothetical protein